ncbi:hypothetical protein [Salinigranum halophilum]|uniref:hypothetical protein n=1 Tax=Salinigranum halophilum TaxID=2565931 RepID=UPI00191BD468|nr:hypothetical protein [Salinigranum halophilum]
MARTNLRERLPLILVGLLIVLMPALVLVATLEVLFLFGDVDLADLSLLELAELYLVEVVLLTLFAAVVYRLTLRTATTRLPDALDRLGDDETDDREARDGDDATGAGDDGTERAATRGDDST